MASKRAKKIEKAWIEAGMRIFGDVNFGKVGWMTYVISFRYTVDAKKHQFGKRW